jgi:hypothetical protein
MKKTIMVSLGGLLCLPASLSSAQTDVCKAMVTNAATNVNLNTADNSYYVSLYNNFCYADGSTNQAAVNSKGSAIVDAIPITGSLSANDNMTKFTNFCTNYKSVAAGSSNSFVYQSAVVGKSLDAANQCLAIVTGHGMSLSYQVSTPTTLLINITVPGGQTMVVQGISADTGVTCVGPDLQHTGKTISYGVGVGQTLSGGSSTITCTRIPFSSIGGQTMYSAMSVAVSSSVGPLNIYWPQDSALPLLTATQIQAAINGVTSQLQQLQTATAFDNLPIGTLLPWVGGGNPPAGWVLCDGSSPQCPNYQNLFLRGAGAIGVGAIGGSDTHNHGAGDYQINTTNASKSGNGFGIGGDHYQVYVYDGPNVPRHVAVRYIMKVSMS